MNVGAMLISFVALIALVNAILGRRRRSVPESMQMIFGWVFAPMAWSLGVPWKDAATIGNLLGTRMVLNEFVAFAQLGTLKDTLDPRSFTIATFALCGFANFASIGMQIGGIGALAPTRPQRPGAARPAGDARGHARQFRDRDHRGLLVVSAFEQATEAADWLRAARVRRRRTSPSSSDRDSATSRTSSAARSAMPYGDIPHWPASRVIGHAGKLVCGTVAGKRVAGAVGPRASLRRPRPADRDLRDARDGPARRAARHPDQRRRRHQHRLFARAR